MILHHIEWRNRSDKPLALKPEYPGRFRSIPLSWMPWLLVPPSSHTPWCYSCGINESVSSTRKNFNYLHHIDVEKLSKKAKGYRWFKSFFVEDSQPYVRHSKYHSHWWPGLAAQGTRASTPMIFVLSYRNSPVAAPRGFNYFVRCASKIDSESGYVDFL